MSVAGGASIEGVAAKGTWKVGGSFVGPGLARSAFHWLGGAVCAALGHGALREGPGRLISIVAPRVASGVSHLCHSCVSWAREAWLRRVRGRWAGGLFVSACSAFHWLGGAVCAAPGHGALRERPGRLISIVAPRVASGVSHLCHSCVRCAFVG